MYFKRITPFISFTFLFLAASLKAFNPSDTTQTPADSVKQENKYLLIPVIVRSPVTRWGGGLAASYLFKYSKKDTVSRTSNFEFLGLYTENKQTVLVLGCNIYSPNENYILRWRNSYSRFPDKFWGLGNKTPFANEESYIYSQFLVNPQLLRKITRKFYAGLFYELQRVYKVSYLQGGLFDQENIEGRNGSTVSGLGVILAWDSRNGAFSPNKGLFAQLSSVVFDKAIFSASNFITYIADVRKFVPVFQNHVLGFQFFGYFNQGTAPIRNLAMLGGSDIMRGYYAGRFRDNHLMACQMEYRAPLFWRLGVVAFAGAGRVAGKFSEFSFDGIKYSLGSGLRLALRPKEKLNLRVDYGFGNHSQGLYVTVGESF